MACPYDAPQFREGENPTMEKCDLCLERWQEGKKPICVEACPTRALDAGPLEELRVTYGECREGELFSYDASCEPSVNFKPKRRRRKG
jgi:anaerobic dimethyl sulfoxide reductase subunit B (iron-sulfur subunit)